jgi:hypothetical protein
VVCRVVMKGNAGDVLAPARAITWHRDGWGGWSRSAAMRREVTRRGGAPRWLLDRWKLTRGGMADSEDLGLLSRALLFAMVGGGARA